MDRVCRTSLCVAKVTIQITNKHSSWLTTLEIILNVLLEIFLVCSTHAWWSVCASNEYALLTSAKLKP